MFVALQKGSLMIQIFLAWVSTTKKHPTTPPAVMMIEGHEKQDQKL